MATFIICIGSDALEVYNSLPFVREDDKMVMSNVMSNVMSKDAEWHWSKEHENAFQRIKHDRTENSCTVSTSRYPIQSLGKLF